MFEKQKKKRKIGPSFDSKKAIFGQSFDSTAYIYAVKFKTGPRFAFL